MNDKAREIREKIRELESEIFYHERRAKEFDLVAGSHRLSAQRARVRLLKLREESFE